MSLPQILDEIQLADFKRLNTYSSLAIVCDSNTHKFCYPFVGPYLPSHELIVFPAGEQNKTLSTCTQVWQQMQPLDRNSLLLNLGGGVVCDLGGFCAATFKRGIAFANMPTSLLAMVDAGYGGKTGIDFQGLKNQIGVFAEPKFVWAFTELLKTLPFDELLSGFAEILKHSLLEGGELWKKTLDFKDFADKSMIDYLIKKSIEFKTRVVLADPREQGPRKILNFGHTVGHAIESQKLIAGNPVLHGQAIAVGMIAEAHISHQLCGLTYNELHQIATKIWALFPKIDFAENIFEWAHNDKKNSSGKLKMSLLKAIGQPIFDVEVSRELFEESLKFYGTGSYPLPPQG